MGQPLVADADGVRWITIDRPEVANALQVEDLDAIAAAVAGIQESTRAVVFTGTGDRAFSAGMHVDSFADLTPQTARELIRHVGDMLRAARLCPVPTVAMLNGACVGAAFELSLVCDLRIAGQGVRVGLPEVLLGIPSVVDAALLPAFVGLAKAREMILTGGLYPVEELGTAYANRIVAAVQLRAATDELIAALTAPTREVLAAQKQLFELWLNNGIAASAHASIDVFGDVFAHPATAAAVDAYRRSIAR
jgi:enoyl-CoA hydratase/carnithine racemase